LIRNFQKPR